MEWHVILGYALGVLLNIAVVAQLRDRAYTMGREFLASGRFALLAVFVLCFAELLVVGRFEALQDANALTALIRDAWVMAGATVGTHSLGKTIAEANAGRSQ